MISLYENGLNGILADEMVSQLGMFRMELKIVDSQKSEQVYSLSSTKQDVIN